MVCHVTYKDENGKWLFPEEAKRLITQGAKIQVGKVEKMSKSKRIQLIYLKTLAFFMF